MKNIIIAVIVILLIIGGYLLIREPAAGLGRVAHVGVDPEAPRETKAHIAQCGREGAHATVQALLRKAANGESCIRCGRIGATVLAHYCGLRQHDYGKGTGLKGHDAIGADLCNGPGSCHEYFDTYESDNDVERSEEFLPLCCAIFQ